jgi:hypothetical protein
MSYPTYIGYDLIHNIAQVAPCPLLAISRHGASQFLTPIDVCFVRISRRQGYMGVLTRQILLYAPDSLAAAYQING